MQIGVDSGKAVENRRIFVVDPDEIARMAVQFMLHDENETHAFGDLEAAFAKAEQWPPELVILGQGLLDGWEAEQVEKIRSRLSGAKLLLLGDESQEAPGHMGQAFSGVVRKPLRIEMVRATVDAALGRPTPYGGATR